MIIDGKNYDDKQPVELVYEPESRVFVKFSKGLKGKAEFANDVTHIKTAMENFGITIPPALRKEFPSLSEKKSAILFNEPGFGKAFYEVYFPSVLDTEKFKWQLID